MLQQEQDDYYMGLALEEARKAAEKGEIPIGAVLVYEGQVVAAAHNLRETGHDGTAHAEMLAIRQGCEKLSRWVQFYATAQPFVVLTMLLANYEVAHMTGLSSDMSLLFYVVLVLVVLVLVETGRRDDDNGQKMQMNPLYQLGWLPIYLNYLFPGSS